MPDRHLETTRERLEADMLTDTKVLELQALFEILQLISQSINLDAILNNIMFTIMGRMMISRSVILLVDDHGQLEIAAAKSVPGLAGVFSLPDHFDQPRPVTDDETEAVFNALHENRIQLVVPLTVDGRMIGMFGLGGKVSKQPFANSELSFLAALGRIASSSIQNSMMFDELENTNEQLDRRVHQLTTLLEIGNELGSLIEFQPILDTFCRSLRGHFLSTRYIVLYRRDGRLEIMNSNGVNTDTWDPQCCESVTQAAQIVDDHGIEGFVGGLVAPLKQESEIHGYILIAPRDTGLAYGEDEFLFLENLANLLATTLSNAVLIESRIAFKQLEDELNLARSIQKRLLPNKTPEIHGVQVIGSNESSKQVGGDYFDFIPVNDERVGLAIGDVSGKGVAAALLMSNLQASMRALTVDRTLDIPSCIGRLNAIIYDNTSPEKYITFFYGEYLPQMRRFEYVNAGHNFPLLFRGDALIRLEEGGLILGMMDPVTYAAGALDMHPGDVLVMYTDGVTEAMNTDEVEFDEVRLIETVRSCAHLSAEEIHNEILRAVFDFSPFANEFDDITLIVCKVNE